MSSNEKVHTIEGKLIDQGGRYAILVSRWNDLITSRLLEGAKDALVRHAALENFNSCMGSGEL